MNEALAAALGMNDLEREQKLDIFVNGGGGTCVSSVPPSAADLANLL